MAQSPEFPELKWVPPRAWNSGRAAGQPTVVVIHSTEGSEGPTSAEDGAAYDQRRTDGTSTHFFVDSNSVVQCVRTTDRANHARATGNKIGIGFELCGRAGQTAAQWHDANSFPMLKLAAKYVAKCCKKYGIPVRRLTVTQLRAGAKGICGHVDITHAFGESTHTDPGPAFPWGEFLTMVNAELNPQEDEMPTAQEIADAVWAKQIVGADGKTTYAASSYVRNTLIGVQIDLPKQVGVLRSDVTAALGRDPVDEDAIVQGVLAGLGAKDPATIAAALKAVLSTEQAAAVGQLLVQG